MRRMAGKKKKIGAAQKRRQQKAARHRLRNLLLVLFIAAAAFGVYSVKKHLDENATTAVAHESALGNTYTGVMVIARNEKLFEAENNSTVDFVASEGAKVKRADTICKVYSSGYNQTEISRLQEYRDEIQTYHVNQVFSNYVDAALDSENKEIASLSRQIRTLVLGRGVGSLSNLEKQLSSALSSRKSYLKQKYPDDQALNELYKEENDQLKKIESWTTTYTATEDCLVSFYTDGFESTVNANTYSTMTTDDVRAVAKGIVPEKSSVSKGSMSIYRTVQEDEWFVLFLCQDRDWNPVVGESYQIQMSGFEGVTVPAVVESFSRIGSDLLLRMRVTQYSVEPVLNIRSCNATVGDFVSGIRVPVRALYMLDGTMGVVVQDGGMQTFVAVTVLSYPDSETAFVRPTLTGSPLTDNKTVLLF